MPGRMDREIEEILARSEEVATSQSRKPRKSQRRGASRWSLPGRTMLGSSFSPGRVFLVGGALLLTALILNVAGMGAWAFLFWPGLILFVFAYALFFVRSGSTPELHWRGRPVDYGRPPSLWQRLRRWLRS